MSRTSIRAAAAIALAALLISALVQAVAPSAASAGTARRAFVVLAPYLTWDDVMNGPMPATREAAETGLVANVNVRSGAVVRGPAALTLGALTLSAGAAAVSDPEALSAYSASETVDGGTAADEYARVFLRGADGAEVLYVGQPRQVAFNAGTNLGTAIGSLGGVVDAAGGLTAAVGNSDPGLEVDPGRQLRPAGIVAADAFGRVTAGDVSPGVLMVDRTAPYGVRTDMGSFERAYRAALDRSPGGALIVLDPGDLARAYSFSSVATTSAAAAARKAALATTDRVVRMALDGLTGDDMLVIVAPTVAEAPDRPMGFAPLIVRNVYYGAGLAAAASTHRAGLVTIFDIATDIANGVRTARPVSMVGSPIVSTGGPAGLSERVAFLQRLDTTAIAAETYRNDTVNTFITLTVIALVAATLLLYRGADDIPARVPAVLRQVLVFLPCVPLAGVLEFAVWRYPTSPTAVLGLMLVLAVGAWGLAAWLGRGRPVAVPMVIVTGLTTAVLLTDQWFGAPLSFANTFGYSALYGARYYGMGNEMAGLVLGSAMVCMALTLDAWPHARWARALRSWGWPLAGAVVLVTAAAPFFGANVGTIAWMTVGFLVGWLMLNGRRVWTWRNALIVVVIVVVMVAGASAFDLMRGSGPATHLGRAIVGAQSGGGLGSLVTIVARKAETNLRVAGRTNWTWLLLAILLLLGYMRWRPRGEFAAMLKEYPAYGAALGAALFAGVVGYGTEDSGIIVPALVLLPVGVTALYLMLSRHGGAGGDRT